MNRQEQVREMTPGSRLVFSVEQRDSGQRLDQWLADLCQSSVSRSRIQKWIKEERVTCASAPVRASRKIEFGENYELSIPEETPFETLPVDLEIKVLYQDSDLAVIVKPPGIAVHPGPGERKTTLINGLVHIWGNLENTGPSFRPGIVHRLDRETEGLLIVAKNENTLRRMSEAFQKREVEKEYLAWLAASPALSSGTIETGIKRHPRDRLKMRIDPTGRRAVTHYSIDRVIITKKGRKFALAKITIETGRTHQIRVHMAHLGCPVIGDPLYSRASVFSKFGMLLLAYRLKFNHPITGKILEFHCDVPERFKEFERVCVTY